MINCEALGSILRDCSNNLGGINQRIYINDSTNIDWDEMVSSDGVITSLALTQSGTEFSTIEFRKNIANFTETYTLDNDGAVMYDQTLVLSIHGRDATKSNKISVIASGQREVDIIIPDNGGGLIYMRKANLSEVGEGTGTEKREGSKYSLTFTAESEVLALYLDADQLAGLLPEQPF